MNTRELNKLNLNVFCQETLQWKERGLGDIMIKHNPSSDKFRVLMRREQVLKVGHTNHFSLFICNLFCCDQVCANHYITEDIKLEPSFGSDQAWTWIAIDFADDEEKVEKFAAKFKTSEIAQEFKDQFQECQVMDTISCPVSF